MDQPLDLDLEIWDAWSPAAAAQHLEGLAVPWYVTAGWALDLFLGRETRTHDDLEIGTPAHRFAEVQKALAGFELVVIGARAAWPVTATTLATHRQTWVREHGGPWRVDVFREPWEAATWIYFRDSRIRLPAARLISHTADGIPYLQPEVVLLSKAKAARPKDESDFATVLPHLDADRRAWLRAALTLTHPGHAWLEPLGTG